MLTMTRSACWCASRTRDRFRVCCARMVGTTATRRPSRRMPSDQFCSSRTPRMICGSIGFMVRRELLVAHVLDVHAHGALRDLEQRHVLARELRCRLLGKAEQV